MTNLAAYIIMSIMFISYLFSQNVEIYISGGYGFAKGAPPLTSYDKSYKDTSWPSGGMSTTTFSNVRDKYASIGEGNRIECGVIFYLKQNLGLYIQSRYSYGSESAKVTYHSKNSSYRNEQITDFGCFSISTGLRFQVVNGFLKPYGGAGVGIYFLEKLTKQFDEWDFYHFVRESKYTSNTPIGFEGYLGIKVDLISFLSLFIEGKSNLVSFYISKYEITKYLINGVDKLGTLKVNERIIVFEENKNYAEISPGEENLPKNGGAPLPVIANSISVSIGLSINL
jgi:hypothetical protein